jgi:signal peptidase II
MIGKGNTLRALGPATVALTLDQGTKWAVDNWMVLHSSIPVLGDLVRLTYIRNPNVIFGIDIGSLGRNIHMLLSAVVIVVVIAGFGRLSAGRRLTETALALVLGGAIGNLCDRIFRSGEVVDFIDVGIGGTRWPVFNVADAAITVGVILWVFVIYLDGWKRSRQDYSHRLRDTAP